MSFQPEITVAAIVERDGRFLLIEERINRRLVFNQPAGHLEHGETLLEAVVRETLEETAWRFEPEALVGVYLWRKPGSRTTFMRFCFCGSVCDHDQTRPLDHGIIATHWLTRSEIEQRGSRLRSPLVLRCLDDHQRGKRMALEPIASLDSRSIVPWLEQTERQWTETGQHERLRPTARAPSINVPTRSRSDAPLIVALSGGVDSAVAALLLKEQGHNVEALFMSNWDDEDAYCTSAQDYQDARAVARELGIPLHRANFAAQYRERVFSYFLDEHRHGRTPNPDVLCNREIKFGVALDYARRLGSERLATGHYARVQHGPRGAELLKGLDSSKDQSYFLHALESTQLDRALLPLGELHKDQVRERARSAGLPVYDKPDSTGICFIGERPFRDFLSHYLSDTPGRILTPEGECLGEHRGLAFYTLGQRAGLAIGGRRGHAERPWYVAGKDPARNALIVVQDHDHPMLTSTRLHTAPMHWIGAPRSAPFQCTVKVRYRQADQTAQANPQPDGSLIVDFEQPQRAVTPGQFAVLYEADRCVGGAMIEETLGAL